MFPHARDPRTIGRDWLQHAKHDRVLVSRRVKGYAVPATSLTAVPCRLIDKRARPAASSSCRTLYGRVSPDKEAGVETVNAIAYANTYHTVWFWSGVRG
jgi:hypothetical protein